MCDSVRSAVPICGALGQAGKRSFHSDGKDQSGSIGHDVGTEVHHAISKPPLHDLTPKPVYYYNIGTLRILIESFLVREFA